MPQLDTFRPQMLFICANFDPHRKDETAHLKLPRANYSRVTLELKIIAARRALAQLQEK